MFGINADDTSSSITCHDAAHIIWHMIHTCLDHLVKVVFVRNLASYKSSYKVYFTNQRLIYQTKLITYASITILIAWSLDLLYFG